MSTLLKSLLAVLTLAPLAASAAPPLCFQVCDSWSCCDKLCARPVGAGYVFTTCGEWANICDSTCSEGVHEPMDAVGTGEDRQADTLVCSETHPAAEQTAPVGS